MITFILYWLAGINKGFMDTLQFRKGTNRLSSSKQSRSFYGTNNWERKYKEDEQGELIPAPDSLYYKAFNLKYKERFPGSATLFVWLADGWHFHQALRTFCILGALLCIYLESIPGWLLLSEQSWHNLLIIAIAFQLPHNLLFELFYSNLLIRKQS
ncbi:MAG: hypothetical protein AAFX87_24005 [Bacteroidota bacterium]